jgi:hypothetical protein
LVATQNNQRFSTISNLTLTKGKVTGNGGAVEQNDDALTLMGCHKSLKKPKREDQ